MRFKLKPTEEPFTVMAEGPFEGRKYRHGETYDENQVPPAEASRFESVPDPTDAAVESDARASKSKDGGKK